MRLDLRSRVLAAIALGAALGTLCAATLHAALPPARPVVVAAAVGTETTVPGTTSPAMPTPSLDPCSSVRQAEIGQTPTTFAARSRAELLANAPRDPFMRHTLEGIAGVASSALADPRVPRCRIDLLRLGEPLFARAHPAATGTWLVPITYGDAVLMTVFVGVDANGVGRVGGGRGGAIPVPTEADARAAATLPNDPVASAELVMARPPGCGASFTAVWRLVRSKGSVVYFALDVFDATPPGVLFEEKDMLPWGALPKIAPYAAVRAAC